MEVANLVMMMVIAYLAIMLTTVTSASKGLDRKMVTACFAT